jgi:long-chain acyl-CoA synthetase
VGEPRMETGAGVVAGVRSATLVSLFTSSVRKCADDPAIRFLRDGEWRTITWNDYGERAASFAAGLAVIGVRRGDHVLLLVRNSPEFFVADVACMLIGAIPISVYNSPNPERLRHVLKDAVPRACVVEDAGFLGQLEQAKSASDRPRVVGINLGSANGDEPSFDDLARADPLDLDECVNAVSQDDTAVMLYTSGTSGPPKGVPLTHRNLVHAVETFSRRSQVNLRGKRQLSYLPLAHIGERFATHYLHLASGAEVACCSDLSKLPSALQAVHPHMFFGAPRMWEKLHLEILDELRDRPDRLAALEAELVARSPFRPQDGPPASGPIRDALAGRGLDEVEIAIVGSAPLPRHVHDFWLRCGLDLADFYGQTETSGMGSWEPHDIVLGTVGRPLQWAQIKISDAGEILHRGPLVFPGYYNRPEENAQAFDDQGWFRTGDLGRFDDSGNLIYLGRRNDMLIPTSGHNVSPIPLETTIARNALVAHVCAVGTRRPHVSALVFVDSDEARRWLAQQGLALGENEPVAEHPDVRAAIRRTIDDLNADLPGAERIRSWRVLDDPWAPDSQVLTPTGKMRRAGVEQRYAAVIDEMYDAANEQTTHRTTKGRSK